MKSSLKAFSVIILVISLVSCGALRGEALIAPALDPAEVEPVFDLAGKDSTLIPEIGSSCGYLIYSEGDASDGGLYKLYKDLAPSEVRNIIDEYASLISSLPNFDVLESPHESSGHYKVSFVYTGAGRVIPEKDSLYVDSGERFALAILYDRDDRDILVKLGDGVKAVDTGHRLSVTDYPSKQVYGEHICSDFYRKGKVYYSKDKQLSAKSGECALLINGDAYLGKATSDGGTLNTVSSFRRAEWINIYLMKNYPVDEDIYTRSDILRESPSSIFTYSKGDKLSLSFSENNGSRFIQPICRYLNDFGGTSIRVLQWDPEGDIVLYFYFELYIENELNKIEGLFVANPTDSETEKRSESSKKNGGSGERTCSSCSGSGRCGSCGGSGYRLQWMGGEQQSVPCASCVTGGRCAYCGGDGKR